MPGPWTAHNHLGTGRRLAQPSAEQAQASGIIGSLVLDTYVPETARYGGPEGLPLAEGLFAADSRGRALTDLRPDPAGSYFDRLAEEATVTGRGMTDDDPSAEPAAAASERARVLLRQCLAYAAACCFPVPPGRGTSPLGVHPRTAPRHRPALLHDLLERRGDVRRGQTGQVRIRQELSHPPVGTHV
ncbi:lantibiotic dehydratase C-terminal domain-containing protein [Streptomyces sp. NPDC004788]